MYVVATVDQKSTARVLSIETRSVLAFFHPTLTARHFLRHRPRFALFSCHGAIARAQEHLPQLFSLPHT